VANGIEFLPLVCAFFLTKEKENILNIQAAVDNLPSIH